MDVVTNGFALAMLLAWATPFQAGLDAMQRKDFAKAETEMTRVLEAKPVVPDIVLAACCQRGRARLGLGRKVTALADFKAVVTAGREHPLRAEALAGYREAGGEMKALWPKQSPQVTWAKLTEATQQEDYWTRLRPLFSDDLWQVLNLVDTSSRLTGEEGFIKEAIGELEEADVGDVEFDDKRAVARMTLRQEEARITLEMLPTGDAWVFNRLLGIAANGEQGVVLDVGQEVQPMVMVNGRIINMQQQFLAEGGMVQANVVVRRGVERKPALEKKDVSPEQQEEIRKLIAQLAAPGPAERAAARNRLKALGDAARPFLREELGNADPEIATTVRELLGE